MVHKALPALLLVLAACTDHGVLVEGDFYANSDGDFGGGLPGVGRPAEEGEPLPEEPQVLLTVESPEDGDQLMRSPVRVTGRVEGADTVMVNGQEAEVERGSFRLSLPLPEGPQVIVASAPGAQDVELHVVVDTRAPDFRIDEPPRGLFHVPETEGPTVTVRGQVEDPGTGVVELTLDGQPVPLDPKGGFSVEVTPPEGLSTIELLATDGAGRTGNALRSMISGAYAPPDQPVDRAVRARVDAATLDTLIGLVQGMVEQEALQGLMGAGGGDFEIRGFRYDRLELDLQPDHGGFRTDIRVHGLWIEVRVKVKILFAKVTLTGEVDVDLAHLNVFLVPRVTPEGSLDVVITNPHAELHGFSFDINDFPDFLEGWLEGMVRGAVEDALEKELRDRVIPNLFDPETLRQEIDLLGTPLTVHGRLQELTVDPEGVSVGAALQSSAPPAEGVPPAPGALVTSPRAGGGVGLDAGDAPVKATVTDDAANRVLHVVWQAGALNLAQGVSEGQELPLALDVGSLAGMFGTSFDGVAPAEAPIEFGLEPLLPPVLLPGDPGVPSPVKLLMGDALLTFQAATDAGPVPLVTLALALDIDLELVAEGGALSAAAAAGARADLVFAAADVNAEQAESTTAMLIATLAPAIGGLVGEQPLPAFQGLAVGDLVLGSTGDDLWLGIHLVPAPPE